MIDAKDQDEAIVMAARVPILYPRIHSEFLSTTQTQT